jgi:hypothetical protein
MSTGLLLIALQWHERKLSLRDTLFLGLVPVAATLTTFLQVVYALGSLEAALFRMLDIAAARTLDLRIEHSQWYPHKKFLRPDHWRRYPEIVRDRIEAISGTPLLVFVSMLVASCIMAGRAAWQRLGFMLVVLVAGVSWNLVMIQHTVVHRFAGMYGWFAWTLVVAVFVRELQRALHPPWLARSVLGLALPIAALTLSREYVPYLQRYVTAARTGQAQPREFVRPARPTKTQRDPQPEAPAAADRLSEDDLRE